MTKKYKKPAKGKLKYQSLFPYCKDKGFNTQQVIDYVRAKGATTAYNSIPRDETIRYQWESYTETGETNLFSSRHEHKFYEHSKRQRAVQLTMYHVFSTLEQLGPLTKTEIKKELGGNNDKRQYAINRLLDEGFIKSEGRKLEVVEAI